MKTAGLMQLRLETEADDWMKELCVELHAQVRILDIRFVGRGPGVAHLADIVTGPEGTRRARLRLSSLRSVDDALVTTDSHGRTTGVVVSKSCKACASILSCDSAFFVSSALTEGGLSLSHRVFLWRGGAPSLLRLLADSGVDYRVGDIGPLSPDVHLTPRQLEVMKHAVEMGLYDFPRRVTKEKAAENLGIKASTLCEILRTAERNIIVDFLGEHTGTAQSALGGFPRAPGLFGAEGAGLPPGSLSR